jgi:NADH-quinone oxidoreductase subunit H
MALPEFVTTLHDLGANSPLAPIWPIVWNLIKIVVVLLPLMGLVAYLTLWERKLIGFIQIRIGPNRVGPMGLLQPIADALKLLFKEIITPAKANPGLFVIGPVMTIMPALAAWAVVPFGPEAVLANVNAGLLLLMAITSMEVYGIIIAGWASNSKYSFMGAMRASAQMISYEIPMGFVFVVILMVSGSLNFGDIVAMQQRGMMADQGLNILSWNWLPLLPLFVVYLTSGLAEANRHPFDVVEGESEIVAGHMVEYSGMAYAMFMLAEYANMILIATIGSIMFLGGWSAPFAFLEFWGGFGGFFWLFAKAFFLVSVFIWVRGTFPRYRYDQIMRLGWKVFIPLTLVYLVFVAGWMQTSWNIWK